MSYLSVGTVLLACIALRYAARSYRRGVIQARMDGSPERSKPRMLERRDGLVLLAAVIVGWLVAAMLGAVLAGALAFTLTRWRARCADRVPAVVAQERFADAVASLAAAVRAGASLTQALRHAATEADTPVREGLDGLVADLEVGVPIEEALDTWRTTAPGPDVDLVVGALELHRRSGGDLPAVLDQVTTSMRERVSIAREVRSLTAQARLSAWILGLLPVGFFAFLWVTARNDVQGALGTSVGVACIAVGLILEGGAVLWIRSLIRVT
jgi:tight adherence protein B